LSQRTTKVGVSVDNIQTLAVDSDIRYGEGFTWWWLVENLSFLNTDGETKVGNNNNNNNTLFLYSATS
jgi:hypothetical protein